MAVITLTKNFVTEVDDDLYEELTQFKWHASGLEGRPARRLRAGPRKMIFMYHQILGLLPWVMRSCGYVVDHIDGNPLNNRRLNLRVVTSTENMRNTIRHLYRIGIGYDSTHDRWKAYIDQPDIERINVGTFRTKIEAEKALNDFKLELNIEDN